MEYKDPGNRLTVAQTSSLAWRAYHGLKLCGVSCARVSHTCDVLVLLLCKPQWPSPDSCGFFFVLQQSM